MEGKKKKLEQPHTHSTISIVDVYIFSYMCQCATKTRLSSTTLVPHDTAAEVDNQFSFVILIAYAHNFSWKNNNCYRN